MSATIFPAKRQNKSQSPIDIVSSPSPKSQVSSSRDDVTYMFIPTSRPRPGNFVINDAKRLLQQYRPIATKVQRSETLSYSITYSAVGFTKSAAELERK
jgi:hypothetical protein